MTPFSRLHSIMPFAIMLYLLTSLVRLHATRPSWSPLTFAHTDEFLVTKIEAGLHWYAAKVGQAEADDVYCLPAS